MKSHVAIVGGGFSGAVIAHRLAQVGHSVDLFETRPHLAGNCHTERDAVTGILLHRYGPHIFHTADERVWRFVNQFAEFVPYVNRVKAIARGRVYSLPINLLTINQYFGKTFSPAEAQAFVASLADSSLTNPRTFEEQALAFIGRELYETFLEGYTMKQWGMHPSQLPASVLKRLPLRFSYDDNYFSHPYQGIPREGYTAIVEKLVDHCNIRVHLRTRFTRDDGHGYSHVFYSGPIDAWFGYAEGRLAYRTLDFELTRADGDLQGTAVMNYCDADIPWTRISEHKHFAPWESHPRTTVFKEFSRPCGDLDDPYYPIPMVGEQRQLQRYLRLLDQELKTTAMGRLGTYRYLDMDVTIKEALEIADRFLAA